VIKYAKVGNDMACQIWDLFGGKMMMGLGCCLMGIGFGFIAAKVATKVK